MQTGKLTFTFGVIVPLLIWVILTPWFPQWDLTISGHFYNDGSFSQAPVWRWIYQYLIIPGWILAAAACIGCIISFKKRFAAWRRPCIYLILTLAIGSGLLIHVLLKDRWGRPRPRQVIEFGGQQLYRPYYQPNFLHQPEPSKSFASGHSTMGFYFFALGLLGIIYRRRFLAWTGMILALGLGGLLSAARIAQGGHFFSDTLASGLIMWLTAWVLAYILFIRREQRHERVDS